MLFRKDIKEIVYDDIKSVLQSNLDELATVDYKEILTKTKEKNTDNKKDFKQEFLKDVCAFVNSYGGWIIYGITDSKQGGKRNASNVVGVSFKDWEEAKQTLRDWIIASTEPKVLFDFHHVAIPDKKDKCVVILRIYPSHSKPHAVIVDKGEPKFYRRFGDATSVMSFRDIREMFFMSSAWSKRIEEFYHDRITRIQNGSTPVPLPNRPRPMPVIQNIETRPFLLNQAIAAIHVIPHSWGITWFVVRG